MKTLDRSKPFQEVYGDDPNINYRFIQDGVKFDNQGNEIGGRKSEPVDETQQEPASTGGKKGGKNGVGN